MNYKEKYENGLECLQEILNGAGESIKTSILRKRLQPFFPELKDDKDERIRKVIYGWICTQPPQFFDINCFSKEEMLAWVEKQKREEVKEVFRPLAGYSIDIAVLQALKKQRESRGNIVLAFNGAYIPVEGKTADEIVSEYHKWLEKQGVQKPVDKVEADFHEGDWIVLNETVYQITEIDDSHVVLSFNGRECKFGLEVLNNAQKFESQFKVGDWITNGRYTSLVVGVDSRHYQFKDGYAKYIDDIDKKYHLWTINDARDGDILACNKEILLFKSASALGHISLHCWYNGQTNRFHSKAVYDTSMTTRNKICPATKEQQDLFIQKMKEAGFGWDTKTKELKEIEPKNPIVNVPSRKC